MQMNKIMMLVLGFLVIAGVGGYVLVGRNSNQQETDDQNQISKQESEEEGFAGTIREAMLSGVGMKCTYEVDGAQYEGFVKGEMYAGKMATATGVGQVIVKDNCMWSWSESEDQGVKMCFEPGENEDSNIWDNPESGLDADLNYNCSPVTVSDSQFTPPNDVEFVDFEGMMQEMMEEVSY